MIAATCLISCAEPRTETREHALTAPTQLCRDGLATKSCRTVAAIETLLAGDLEILAARGTGSGYQGARVLTLRSRGPRAVVFRAKWRAHATTTVTNTPRYELAAYAVQKLFLEPREYVVPPTAAYCFPLAAYRAHVDSAARETFPRTSCVYGLLSYWIEDVTVVAAANRAGWFRGLYQHAFDPHLFERDPTYRDSITRVNLLTYVIAHRDTHSRNFVIARSGTQPVAHTVYSVDNSKSFTMPENLGINALHDWSAIRVPSLPRAAIDRLRGADVSSLAVIAVLRRADDRLVVTPGETATPGIGVEWKDDRLVVGLTATEIAEMRARIAELLRRVDQNDVALH